MGVLASRGLAEMGEEIATTVIPPLKMKSASARVVQ